MPPRPTSSAPGMAVKRIKKEIADLSKENLGAISLSPDESDIFQWKAILPGPSGSPYEGGVFEVQIKVPDDYPFSPPHLHFITKVYHCNIASTGAICLDLLKHAWSPALSLYKVVLSLSSLLTDPNPSDPLVPAIAQEYRKDRKKHDATAKEWVQKYALPKKAPTEKQILLQPTRASSSRPRAITRPSSVSVSANGASPAPSSPSASAIAPAPVPQIAGTRRTINSRDPIDLVNSDSDDEGGVVATGRRPVNGTTSNTTGAADTNGNGNGSGTRTSGSAAAGPGSMGERRSKRSRNSGPSAQGAGGSAGGSAGDAIVIDE